MEFKEEVFVYWKKRGGRGVVYFPPPKKRERERERETSFKEFFRCSALWTKTLHYVVVDGHQSVGKVSFLSPHSEAVPIAAARKHFECKQINLIKVAHSTAQYRREERQQSLVKERRRRGRQYCSSDTRWFGWLHCSAVKEEEEDSRVVNL